MHSSTVFFWVVILFGKMHAVLCTDVLGHLFEVCDNRKLNNPLNILDEHHASSKLECATACRDNSKCLSVNVIRVEFGYTCQIMSDAPAACDSLEEDNESVYFKPVAPRCINGGTWNFATQNCGTCNSGFAGTFCERYIIDCYEGTQNGQTGTGKFVIKPLKAPAPFLVKCDLQWGMTELEYRGACGSIGDFNKNWTSYRSGFGDVNCNYFIGLEKMYWLTSQRATRLKVQASGSKSRQAYYHDFHIDDEANRYTLRYTKYESHTTQKGGDGFGLGAPLQSINDTPFCIEDRDCNLCAQTSNSGWWFNTNCAKINLHSADENQLEWPKEEFDNTLEKISSFRFYLEGPE